MAIRYHRKFIVFSDIHSGYIPHLSPLPLTVRHLVGVIPNTSPNGLAECYAFDKQSLEPINCAHLTPNQSLALPWDPFSRSYGATLQSSLERVLSRALVYSHSPTCVGYRYGHPRFNA